MSTNTLTDDLATSIVDSGAESVLDCTGTASARRAEARRLSTVAYNALVSFGFVAGFRASATTAQNAIAGQYLAQVPLDQDEAIEKAWELLGAVLDASITEVLARDDSQAIVITSRITDAVMDTLIESGSFVR